MGQSTDSEAVVREIRRKTRRRYSAEERIRIVLEGLKGEESIAELSCSAKTRSGPIDRMRTRMVCLRWAVGGDGFSPMEPFRSSLRGEWRTGSGGGRGWPGDRMCGTRSRAVLYAMSR